MLTSFCHHEAPSKSHASYNSGDMPFKEAIHRTMPPPRPNKFKKMSVIMAVFSDVRKGNEPSPILFKTELARPYCTSVKFLHNRP